MRVFVMLSLLLLLGACGGSEDFVSEGSGNATPAPQIAMVYHVVDGDTVDLALQGELLRARLLGIDAPEVGECFAVQATEYLRTLALGQWVVVAFEQETPSYDVFGRLLVYLSTLDGDSLNLMMVASGHAYAYTQYPTRLEALIAEAQIEAAWLERGLWGEACR